MDQPRPVSIHKVAAQTRYPVGAFNFVRLGLDYTVQNLHKNAAALPETERHVSGQQLCRGLRDFAIDRYGRLARTVLHRWHINRTEDFGHIVFAMVEAGLMQATESDSIRDFATNMNFDQIFTIPIPVDKVPLKDEHMDFLTKG